MGQASFFEYFSWGYHFQHHYSWVYHGTSDGASQAGAPICFPTAFWNESLCRCVFTHRLRVCRVPRLRDEHLCGASSPSQLLSELEPSRGTLRRTILLHTGRLRAHRRAVSLRNQCLAPAQPRVQCGRARAQRREAAESHFNAGAAQRSSFGLEYFGALPPVQQSPDADADPIDDSDEQVIHGAQLERFYELFKQHRENTSTSSSPSTLVTAIYHLLRNKCDLCMH